MKKFDNPLMIIQEIDAEEILSTSDCWTEALACLNCYDSAAACDTSYYSSTCTQFSCPRLQEIMDCEFG